MTVAQGINKQTIVKKQTALGTPATGAGGQVLRRRTSVFSLNKDTYESDEIVTHQQSTGAKHGLRRAAGRISGLLSPETYKLLFAAALRADFVAGATVALSDVTAQEAAPQFTTAAGDFLDEGFKVGDVVRWTGFAGGSAPDNNAKNFLITALTATQMTGVFLNGDAVVADASGDAVTVTVVGKKTKVPLTGHTDDLFTFEEWYPELSKSELFTDVKVNSVSLGLPASGNATVEFDLMGLDRTLANTQQLTTPTAETSTEILAAVQGFLYVNGVLVSNVTGVQITINEGVTSEPVVGSNSAPDLYRGRVRVTGQFTALYQSDTFSALYDAETETTLVMVVSEGEEAAADFMVFSLGRLKFGGDAPDDGEKGIVRTFPFVAEINTAGGAALAWDETIMSIQDSAA